MTIETTNVIPAVQELADTIHPMMSTETINLYFSGIRVFQLTDAIQKGEIGYTELASSLVDIRAKANAEAKEHEQELLVVLNEAIDGLIALAQPAE